MRIVDGLFPYIERRSDTSGDRFSVNVHKLLLLIFTGLLHGFNFFWCNFFIGRQPVALVLPLAGIVPITLFLASYLIIAGVTTIKVRPSGGRARFFTALFYCFLLPYFCFDLIHTGVTVVLLTIDARPLLVYFHDYSRYVLYIWIISLTMRYTETVEKEHKYALNLRIIGSFVAAYVIVLVTMQTIQVQAADFFR